MRGDLFELIDGLFRGTVYFLYNVIETIFWAARHPFRGPRRLYRAHCRSDKHQIAGITTLFLTYLFAYWFYLNSYSGAPGPSEILSRSLTLPGDKLWPALAASLVSATIVDSMLRIYARARVRQETRRRKLVGTTEYALLLPTPVATAVGSAFPGEFGFDDYWREAAIGLLLCCVLILPAASHFRSQGWSPAGKRKSWSQRLRLPSPDVIAIAFGLILLLMVAGKAGSSVVIELAEVQIADAGVVEIADLNCHLGAQVPHVDAVIRNGTTEPLLVSAADYTLYVGKLDMEVQGYRGRQHSWKRGPGLSAISRLDPDQPDGRPALIAPRSSELVRYRVRDLPSHAWPAGTECALSGFHVPGGEVFPVSVQGGPWAVVQADDPITEQLFEWSRSRFDRMSRANLRQPAGAASEAPR
jgi:hypothetical protein